jgi:hypothetical protein
LIRRRQFAVFGEKPRVRENRPDWMPKPTFTTQNPQRKPSLQIPQWQLVHGRSLRYDESEGHCKHKKK